MKKNDTSPAVGGSSLLVIFGVLCLTVFSLLTLTTAQSEKRLSDSAAASCTAYYEADRQAEAIFARLRTGELPEQVTRNGSEYRYSIPITEYQSLQVTLEKKDRWQVLQWQTVLTAEPVIEETLSLWDGVNNQEVEP